MEIGHWWDRSILRVLSELEDAAEVVDKLFDRGCGSPRCSLTWSR